MNEVNEVNEENEVVLPNGKLRYPLRNPNFTDEEKEARSKLTKVALRSIERSKENWSNPDIEAVPIEKKVTRSCNNGHTWETQRMFRKDPDSDFALAGIHYTEGGITCPECNGVAINIH